MTVYMKVGKEVFAHASMLWPLVSKYSGKTLERLVKKCCEKYNVSRHQKGPQNVGKSDWVANTQLFMEPKNDPDDIFERNAADYERHMSD